MCHMTDVDVRPNSGTTGSSVCATVMNDSRLPVVEQFISVIDGVF